MRKSGCNKLTLRARVRPRNDGISLFRRFVKMGASTTDCIWQRAESIPELLNLETEHYYEIQKNGASNPDHGSAEGISTPGQSREFGSGTLRRTVEITRWSKPNRTRLPPEYLRERNGSWSQLWRHVGPAPCGWRNAGAIQDTYR